MNDSSRTPGEILRKAREMQGLSQMDVVKRLRLKLPIIQDIENDHYHNMAAMVYMRGYLRAYCRALSIPEQDVMSAFNQLGIIDPAKPLQEPRAAQALASEESDEEGRSFPFMKYGLFGLLGLLIIAALLVWWGEGKSSSGKNVPVAVKALPQNETIVLPADPAAVAAKSQAALATVEVPVPTPKEDVANNVINTAENALPVEKSPKLKHHPKHHKIAHHALKPNYTLRPVTE